MTKPLKINKVESEIKNINMHFNSENSIVVNLNIVGKNQEDLDFGTLNVYDDKGKIASIEIEDYDVEFTLDKKYNEEDISELKKLLEEKKLKFEVVKHDKVSLIDPITAEKTVIK